jgi:hypothetical protein
VRLHGYRAWAGWLLDILCTTHEDGETQPVDPRFFEFDVPENSRHRHCLIIREAVRDYVGTIGTSDYGVGPMRVLVEWPDDPWLEPQGAILGLPLNSGLLPFRGMPDLRPLKPAFDILKDLEVHGGRTATPRASDLDFLARGAARFYLREGKWPKNDDALGRELGMSEDGVGSMKKQRGKGVAPIKAREIKARAQELIDSDQVSREADGVG